MRIEHSIANQTIHRLEVTQRAISRSLERLSTGKRLNSPRDGASDFGASIQLDSQARGFSQALRNINQGLSLLQTADSAISSQIELVERMREIAVQSSNSTLSDTDRENLNGELQSLLSEFNRITATTEFNGTQLIDGSLNTLSLTVGANRENQIDVSVSSMLSNEVFQKTAGRGTFSVGQSVSTGDQPLIITTGDLNNDGNMDLVTADDAGSGMDGVSIALGRGDGTFEARRTLDIQSGASPRDIKIADINNDGINDIITADGGINQVSFFMGQGDGTFEARITVAMGTAPVALEIGDVNEDGNLDIAVARENIAGINLFLGGGNGSFTQTTSVSQSYYSVTSDVEINLRDLNADGHLDMIVATSSGVTGGAGVSLGLGNGLFGATTNYSSSTFGATDLAVGDIDNDGDLDFLLANGNDAYQTDVYKNNGSGVFTASTAVAAGAVDLSLDLVDFNNDGNLDILTADYADSGIYLNLGRGNGTFASRSCIATSVITSLAIEDFNEDGALDFSTAATNSDVMSVFLARTQNVSALSDVNVNTAQESQALITILDTALSNLLAERSNLGSLHSRLETASSHALLMNESIASAKSTLEDTDIAEETAELVRLQITQQAQVAVMAQANLSLQAVVELLRF